MADKMVNCPRGCGTMVRESKAGDPHTVRVYDPIKRDYVSKTCQ